MAPALAGCSLSPAAPKLNCLSTATLTYKPQLTPYIALAWTASKPPLPTVFLLLHHAAISMDHIENTFPSYFIVVGYKAVA
jgi:hypothetical protein